MNVADLMKKLPKLMLVRMVSVGTTAGDPVRDFGTLFRRWPVVDTQIPTGYRRSADKPAILPRSPGTGALNKLVIEAEASSYRPLREVADHAGA